MDRVVKNKNGEKKLTIFSGHDTNVAPMLSFYNLSSPECVKKKYKNETVT
jgi:hypothetical protein